MMLMNIKYGKSKYIRKYNNESKRNKKNCYKYSHHVNRKAILPIKQKFNDFEILGISESWDNTGYDLLLMKNKTMQIKIYNINDKEINKYISTNSAQIFKSNKKRQYTNRNSYGNSNAKYKNKYTKNISNNLDFTSEIYDYKSELVVVPFSTTNVYINGIPKHWNYTQVHKYFSKYGTILSVHLYQYKRTNYTTEYSRGSGFIDFKHPYSAEKCIEQMRYMQFAGCKPLIIKYAHIRKQKELERCVVIKKYPDLSDLKIKINRCQQCQPWISQSRFHTQENCLKRYKINLRCCVDCVDCVGKHCGCDSKYSLVIYKHSIKRCEMCFLKWYPKMINATIEQVVNISLATDIINILCDYCNYKNKSKDRKYCYDIQRLNTLMATKYWRRPWSCIKWREMSNKVYRNDNISENVYYHDENCGNYSDRDDCYCCYIHDINNKYLYRCYCMDGSYERWAYQQKWKMWKRWAWILDYEQLTNSYGNDPLHRYQVARYRSDHDPLQHAFRCMYSQNNIDYSYKMEYNINKYYNDLYDDLLYTICCGDSVHYSTDSDNNPDFSDLVLENCNYNSVHDNNDLGDNNSDSSDLVLENGNYGYSKSDWYDKKMRHKKRDMFVKNKLRNRYDNRKRKKDIKSNKKSMKKLIRNYCKTKYNGVNITVSNVYLRVSYE
eukprot:430576_1